MSGDLVHRFAAPTSRFARVVVGSVALAALAGLALWWGTRSSLSACESEVRSGNWQRAIAVCLASHHQRGDDADLVWAAKAHIQLDQLGPAGDLARRLLARPLHGDAHGILSYIALRSGDAHAAQLHATLAFVGHLISGDQRGLTNAAVSISQAAWKVGDFTAALAAADQAVAIADDLREPRRQVAAYLARADALGQLGDTQEAAATLARAIDQASDPCDRAWARHRRGMNLAVAGQDGLALLEFALAAKANVVCDSAQLSAAVSLIQAWLLRRKDPAAALARLNARAKLVGDSVEMLVLRAYLAADRGALAEAGRHLAHAARRDAPHADWPWEIACAQAELQDLAGGPLAHPLMWFHYRRSAAMVAALRATAQARSAYLVSSHRDPYDGLIALHARQGRWREALSVVLELDASDMLRATASATAIRQPAPLVIAAAAPAASPVRAPDIEAVLASWRDRDLVVVIAQAQRKIGSGRERVYRIHIANGRLTGEDVGDASAARRWANELFADPGNRAAARALGQMFVPREPSSRTLHVLAIGSLGKVPLGALRGADDSLIVGRRPLARVLGVQAVGPASSSTGPAVVLADPRGDLPKAAQEGRIVARALGASARLAGSMTTMPATRARLWDARDASLLHVAGHVGALGHWRTLRLADGDVSPAEMVQHRLAPRIAVLAGCGSAAATDEEGWGSIAAALITSGTAAVVASDRSIGDEASLALMSDFYAQPDWQSEPARALARVQLALDRRATTSSDEVTRARTWAAFSVLARPPAAPLHATP